MLQENKNTSSENLKPELSANSEVEEMNESSNETTNPTEIKADESKINSLEEELLISEDNIDITDVEEKSLQEDVSEGASILIEDINQNEIEDKVIDKNAIVDGNAIDEDTPSFRAEEEEPAIVKEEKSEKRTQKAIYDSVKAGEFYGNIEKYTVYNIEKKNESQFEKNKHANEFESENEPESDDSFKDPTKELKKEPKDLPDIISNDSLLQQKEILHKEGILVLTCLDERLVFDVARKLAFQFDGEKYDRRQLLLGTTENKSKYSIDIFRNEQIGTGKDTIVLVDVKSSPFFGSMISMSYSISEALKEVLLENDMLLILTVSSELWIKDIREKGKNFYLKVWDIPILEQGEIQNEKASIYKDKIPDKENLQKIILYTITFFPGLNQEDFEKIILILLNAVNKKQKKKQKIKEKWLEQPDYYLTKCGIVKLFSESYDSEIIDFEDSNVRVFLRQHFSNTQSFYIRQKFETLLDCGLLFDLTTNAQITNNLIGLIIKKLSGNTKNYSASYLHKITRKIIDPSLFKIDSNCTVEEFWKQLGHKHLLGVIRSSAIQVFAQLLDEMLSNAKLKDAVKSYLDNCMMHNRDMVQELTEQLRYSPNFDKFFWIKRLLNEGNLETRDKSYSFLIRLSKQMGIRIYEFIDVIESWLPEQETPFDNYSHANVYGLNFIIDYTNEITKKFPIANFGYYPSQYSLFATLDEHNASNRLNIIVGWLFNPKLERTRLYLIKNQDNNKKINAGTIINDLLAYKAYLIEVWYAILSWRLSEVEIDEANSLRNLMEELLNQTCKVTSKEIQNRLKQMWENKSKFYAKESGRLLQEISKQTKLDSPYRKQLLEKRSFILKSFTVINQMIVTYKQCTIRKNLNI